MSMAMAHDPSKSLNQFYEAISNAYSMGLPMVLPKSPHCSTLEIGQIPERLVLQ